jgi:hypothetical protein
MARKVVLSSVYSKNVRSETQSVAHGYQPTNSPARSNHHGSPNEFGVEESPFDPQTSPNSLVDQRVQKALDLLKSQHAMLSKSLPTINLVENSTTNALHGSPLPSTVEEEVSGGSATPTRFSTPMTRVSKRSSIATSLGDSLNEWFDAPDDLDVGAQEFFLDDQDNTFQDEKERASRILTNDSRSSLDTEDSSRETGLNKKDGLPENAKSNPSQVVRRTRLPTGPVGDEGSLFAILKKNVGKARGFCPCKTKP